MQKENIKYCHGCKKTLSTNLFRKNSSKKDGFQSQCIECRKEYNKSHYKNNKQKYIDKAKESNKKLVDWYKAMKSTLECKMCGESHSACLHFHHRDQDSKEFGIATYNRLGKTKLLREIEKCDVLCGNCHAKHHYEIRKK